MQKPLIQNNIYALWFRSVNSPWKHLSYIILGGMEVLCSMYWRPCPRCTFPSLLLRSSASSFLIILIYDTPSAWRFCIKWIWRAWEGVPAFSIHYTSTSATRNHGQIVTVCQDVISAHKNTLYGVDWTGPEYTCSQPGQEILYFSRSMPSSPLTKWKMFCSLLNKMSVPARWQNPH